ncbi:MAG: hypothetical protein JO235_00175 [Chroococcidiopsidaceae cyanobacterium CP_BM_RX_35]|nr:hypothetical protein [Chroococcidiopsidaceae cyanobacterium CP_BM_RX_35]
MIFLLKFAEFALFAFCCYLYNEADSLLEEQLHASDRAAGAKLRASDGGQFIL